MKLDPENIRKHVIAVVKQDPAIPDDELRDGLPVISIDGVKCAVDAVNGVIQTGEGKEQRWFELHLRDVTPKRFLTPEEQVKLDAEHEDWWLVSSSQRSCFVRNRKRSGAVEDFLRRFPGEAAFGMDAPEAELARGFEFIDDEGDRIRAEFIAKEVMETEAIPPGAPRWPQPSAPQPSSGVGGCPPGHCSCGGCYPEPSLDDALTQPCGNEQGSPGDFYFGIGDSSDDRCLAIVPKEFWDANHRLDSCHYNVHDWLPTYFQGEDDPWLMRPNVWILPSGKLGEDVAIDMTVAGFERNAELEALLERVHES